jgi:hypothetical protein
MAEEGKPHLMAPKPPTSYAAFELNPPPQPEAPVQPAPTTTSAELPPQPRPARQNGRTLKEASAHVMTYIHPDAAKALKRYAVENNCKVHDLCVEAFEDWFRAHGLREKVRAEPKRRI